ncbi:MAG: tRNA uridine-5-carboxymethylaminomethyl(34) synthesis GTPase MnmE [Candidatus Izimaplasma sp.]|nr:tRNA uridine-5-carboxymethylaminomethyl(34) synthesis GTPase MnmE [Candidatus Izimaplasma bacterium]
MIFDTIVAKSTADGISAINIIRVSGDESFTKVNEIFKGPDLTKAKSHTVHYGHIHNQGEIIDEVMVSIFKTPKTFTTENIVEISCHGGNFIANEIIKILISNGVRLAQRGEFTKRAYLNGRIDLTEAESIMDMVNAKSHNQLKIANEQLRGDVKVLINTLQENILNIIANIEVNIDYPEYDDVEELTNTLVIPKITGLLDNINKIIKESETGQVIREGIKTVIIGKPNVGKSSLLNSLLKEDKAIVTDISGTTRDLIEAELNLNGVILKLVDTAGIRSTKDIIERIGINKSKKAISEADLILLVLNQSEKLTELDKELLELTKGKERILIGNKMDLGNKLNLEGESVINISAIKNQGLDQLANKVKQLFLNEKILNSDTTILSNARHIGKLREVKKALEDAIKAAKDNLPIDFIEIDLRKAWANLGEITGKATTDDLLNNLFSKFCLGK